MDDETITTKGRCVVELLGDCAPAQAAEIIAKGIKDYCDGSKRQIAKVDSYMIV